MRSRGYENLKDFLQRRMRMSHIYQPLMLRMLLTEDGSVPRRAIAAAFLAHDESQLDYYEHIITVMPGPVLRRHGVVEQEADRYRLRLEYLPATDDERNELAGLCDSAIAAYKVRRGRAIWAHRQVGLGALPGQLRYEVLKRAGFRCDLCGVPADERAIDVDHILPRKHGGADDLANLQALCWQCNSNKGAGDDTDFRAVRASYEVREPGCPFCELPADRVMAENALALVIRDKHPVTPLHTPVLPKRHVPDYFSLHQAERNAIEALLHQARAEVLAQDATVQGFNVGINSGDVAGQTIFHCHVHLIPRRSGDVPERAGGVRHLIPGKGSLEFPGFCGHSRSRIWIAGGQGRCPPSRARIMSVRLTRS